MRTLCCNKDYSSRAVNCFSAPLRVFFLLHNGKMEQEESGAKSHLLPKHCTPDGMFTWKMVHFQEPHGHRLWFQHAGTVLAMGLYTHQCCRSAGGSVWGRGEDHGEHRCREADEKSICGGNVNNSSLSFSACLRMLVVFLHSLEGTSES